MKYKCAHCGENVFNPFQKLFAGTIKSKGVVCKNCGGYNVNGLYCSIVTTVLMAAALIYIIYFINTGNTPEKLGLPIWLSPDIVFVAAFLLSRVNMMFFGKLIKSMRTDLDK